MTAVEWFFRWVNDNPEATHKEYAEAFEQAKQMEKEQHGKTWDKALDTYVLRGANYVRAWQDFDDYYNKTYGSKESNKTKTTYSYTIQQCPGYEGHTPKSLSHEVCKWCGSIKYYH